MVLRGAGSKLLLYLTCGLDRLTLGFEQWFALLLDPVGDQPDEVLTTQVAGLDSPQAPRPAQEGTRVETVTLIRQRGPSKVRLAGYTGPSRPLAEAKPATPVRRVSGPNTRVSTLDSDPESESDYGCRQETRQRNRVLGMVVRVHDPMTLGLSRKRWLLATCGMQVATAQCLKLSEMQFVRRR